MNITKNDASRVSSKPYTRSRAKEFVDLSSSRTLKAWSVLEQRHESQERGKVEVQGPEWKTTQSGKKEAMCKMTIPEIQAS